MLLIYTGIIVMTSEKEIKEAVNNLEKKGLISKKKGIYGITQKGLLKLKQNESN